MILQWLCGANMNFKKVICVFLIVIIVFSLCGCAIKTREQGEMEANTVKHLYISLPDGNVVDGFPDYLFIGSHDFVAATINGVRYETSLSRCVIIYE